MKELRFSSNGGADVWRVAFAFDPERKAIVLVAGAKQGMNERSFYRRLLHVANARFDRHLASLIDVAKPVKAAKRPPASTPGKGR